MPERPQGARNAAGSRSLVTNNELMLYGIVDAYAYSDTIRAIDVIDSLAQIPGDEVVVRINSPGGSVTEGIAIYNALRADRRKIVVRVDSIAASIASVIAMAGDEIVIAETASIMIHDPWAFGGGTSDELRALADEIDRLKAILVGIYASRTGMPADEIESLMAAETYMGATEALERKFADRVDVPLAIAASSLSREDLARLVVRDLARISIPETPVNAAPSAPTQEARMPENNNPAPAPAPVDENAIRAQAVEAERARVTTIRNLGRTARVSDELVDRLVSTGATVDAANTEIMAAWNAAQEAASGQEINSRVQVTRDERATVVAGMTAAIAHQLGARNEIDDNARRFMDYGILDVAAELSGYRGRLHNAAQRETMIRNAMHRTSDFPLLLENALNRSLEGRYMAQEPTYRRISRQRTYRDFRDHSAVRMGDFPTLQPVGQTGEIKAGTMSEKREKTSVSPYAIQFSISRQLLVNDDLGGIAQILADYGISVARFEESTFYAMMTANPTLLETTRAVFNTTDKTLASANAAISVDSVGKGRAAMRKRTSVDGQKINVAPSILLVGPDKETEAETFVASVVAAQQSNVNPFSGKLSVVSAAELGDGNAWYLFANPAELPCFEWGLLDGYTAPRLRIEEPFGIQGTKVSLEHDFGCGAIDYRGGYKNNGA